MRHTEGRKFKVIKAWLSEEHRESNELCPFHQYTAYMVLCKNRVYTPRLPLLSGTHNMRHYLTCLCVCVLSVWVGTWVHVYEHTIVLPLSYISHTQRGYNTHITKRQHHTNYCPEHQFKVQIILPRYKVARGVAHEVTAALDYSYNFTIPVWWHTCKHTYIQEIRL